MNRTWGDAFALQGVKVSWSHFTAELTLALRWIEQPDHLDNSLLPQFLLETKVLVKVFDDCRLTNLLLVGKGREDRT